MKEHNRRNFQMTEMPNMKGMIQSVVENAQRGERLEVFEKKLMPKLVEAIERLVDTNSVSKGEMRKLIQEVTHLMNRVVTEKKPVINMSPVVPAPIVNVAAPNMSDCKIMLETEQASKWEFTIHRADNGLMKSVTAERV